MQIRVGLEQNIEGRQLAWALDYPGCFSYGVDEAEALIRLPQALLNYEIWIKDHTPKSWVDFADLDIRIVERFETFNIFEDFSAAPDGKGHEINAWFLDDWRPLSQEEMDQSLTIFRWQREELLAGISTLDPDLLDQGFEGEPWTINRILKHIAHGELWYLNRLNLTELTRADLPKAPLDRLEKTYALVKAALPNLVGSQKVIGVDGEFWSPRKFQRRLLWHQRDHIEQIKKQVI